jgi:glycosyltransferase involved in cell wall biosynthesis
MPLPDGFALAAGRWIPYKRFDLVIAAAEEARMPLVIAGGGPEEAQLRKLAARSSTPVFFVHHPSREVLRHLYRNASVFIFPAHEDFGMMPVEAQAAGTPVAALASGGSLESVRDGVTGRLAAEATAQTFATCLLEAMRYKDSHALHSHAEQFAPQVFVRRVHGWIHEHCSGGTT